MELRKWCFLLSLLLVAALIVTSCAKATPTPTPTPAPTAPPVATPTPAPTAPPAATPTPTATPVATPKATPTPTPIPTATATPTPTPKPTPLPKRKLVMVEGYEFPSLDFVDVAGPNHIPVTNIYDPLVRRDQQGQIVSWLATSWEQAGPKRWRFYLRKGVKFHDGHELTAEDVAATANWLAKSKGILIDFVPVAGAEVMDKYAVDIITPGNDPQFPYRATMLFIYPTSIARDNPDLAKNTAIGTGAYKLVKWDRGTRMTFTYFEDYWGPKPQITDVEILYREEAAVRLAMLQKGEAQIAFPLQPDQAKSAPKLVRQASDETWMERSNVSVGQNLPMADKRLRLAVNYAVDRKGLIDSLNQGYASPASGQRCTPACFGWNPDLKDYPYDLEKAKSLVKEAGAVGKTISLVATSGRYPKDRELNEAVAYAIQQAGLKVDLRFPEYKEWLDYLFTSGERRAIMSDLWAAATSTETLDIAQGRFYAEPGANGNSFDDARLTQLWKEYDAATDIAGKSQKLQGISRIVQEEGYIVWLLKPDFLWGLAKNLEWKPTPEAFRFITEMRFTD